MDEREQKIRDLFKLPVSSTPEQVDAIFVTVKNFLHAASSAKATKPLTQASLSKLYSAGENTTSAPPPAPDVEKPTPPSPNEKSQSPPQPQEATQTAATATSKSPPTEVPPLHPESQPLQSLNNFLSLAIAVLIIVTGIFGYNKFVVAPEKRKQEILAQKEEKRQKYKHDAELTAKQEAEKRADCDRVQASIAGIVANKELARQQRYEAYKAADPHGLPLVPNISDLKRELKDVQTKINLLESTNPNAMDAAIQALQDQIDKDQAEADSLNAKAGGSLWSPAAGRHSYYTEGYNEFHALQANIDANKRKMNELYALKENPYSSLETLKKRRSQIQIELGTN